MNVRPRYRALLVACDDYRSLGTLTCSENDGEEFKSGLIRYWGFREEDVVLLTTGATEDGALYPTRENVLARLVEAVEVDPCDVFLFAFWGHGLTREDEAFFCLPETDLSRLKRTALSQKELDDFTDKIATSDVCFFLDCCREEVVEDDCSLNSWTSVSSATTVVAAFDSKFGRSKRETGRRRRAFLFSSCSDGEISREDALLRRGLFTGQFLKAQRLCFDSGETRFREVAEETARLVEERSRELGLVEIINGVERPLQNPRLSFYGAGDLMFVPSPDSSSPDSTNERIRSNRSIVLIAALGAVLVAALLVATLLVLSAN